MAASRFRIDMDAEHPTLTNPGGCWAGGVAEFFPKCITPSNEARGGRRGRQNCHTPAAALPSRDAIARRSVARRSVARRTAQLAQCSRPGVDGFPTTAAASLRPRSCLKCSTKCSPPSTAATNVNVNAQAGTELLTKMFTSPRSFTRPVRGWPVMSAVIMTGAAMPKNHLQAVNQPLLHVLLLLPSLHLRPSCSLGSGNLPSG